MEYVVTAAFLLAVIAGSFAAVILARRLRDRSPDRPRLVAAFETARPQPRRGHDTVRSWADRPPKSQDGRG
jgi:hypothetical protein